VSAFPATRLRRFRRTGALRELVRETRLDLRDLVYPLFACPGSGVVKPLEGLPGIAQRSVDRLADEAEELLGLGIGAVLLFGIPEEKDDAASGAYDEGGIVQQALRALSERAPELVLLTDVCLCEYTSHGHCGVVEGDAIVNDLSLELLAKTAVSHADAGAHAVCPSDMMDGRVGAIRGALDSDGFEQVPIVSYAAKAASAFYGPFREAAESTPAFGDRRSYQMDPANAREALRGASSTSGGRGRADDQAGAPVARRHRCREGALRRPDLRLQRERRVRDGEGRRGARLARRAPRRDREPDGDQARGGGRDRLLLGEGAGGLAVGTSLFRRARGLIPGGVNSPVRAWNAVSAGEPFFARRGEGAHIEDTEGRRYVDWVMSWGPLVFGHADPEIVEAVQEAAAEATTFGVPTEREVELPEEIVDAVPSIEKVLVHPARRPP
jgi:porphobilinogen synthase